MRDLYESTARVIERQEFNAELLYASYSKYGQDWFEEMHAHHFTELFYVLNGKGSLRVKELTQPLKTGDVVIVNSNIAHTETGSYDAPLEYIVLGIDGMDFDFHQDMLSEYAVFNSCHGNDDLLFYFRTILHEMQKQVDGYDVICKSFVDALLVKVNRNLASSIIRAEGRQFNQECNVIKRYIDHHFSENITLDQLAEIAHMNKYHLVHSFKRDNGISPISYLNQKRISESENLLITTDHSLSRIAHILGFSSPSYFSQSFKKVVGVSPNEYRKLKQIQQRKQ